MPDDTPARWTVSVSRDTDTALRRTLAQRGLKRGDLSRFVEDAVRWRMLDQAMADARAGFADLPPDAVDALANEALATVRHARRTPPKIR